MKRLFIVFAIFFINTVCYGVGIDDNIDYSFMDNAFSEKPVTNQEFENLMKQYEKPREGFFTKMYKFFDKDKAKYDEAFKKRYESPNNQPLRIKDVPEDKPTVLISSEASDYSGNIVRPGYYQVELDKKEGNYFLNLTEGANKNIATLKARQIEENEDAKTVIYTKAEITKNGFIKIIYSNLDITLVGYLKIKENNKEFFEEIY